MIIFLYKIIAPLGEIYRRYFKML